MTYQDKGYARTQAGLVHWRQVCGPGAPIVLLHRTPVSSASFDQVLARLVKAQTGGVNHVLELGGAGALAKSSASLAIGGHIALIGALAGFGGDLSAAGMVMGAQRATAIAVGSRAEHLAMSAFVARHGLKPQVDATFALDAIEEAYARTAGGAFGKVVVEFG